MENKEFVVYTSTDPYLTRAFEESYQDNDFTSFKEYAEEEYPTYKETSFDNENEAVCFIDGFVEGHIIDERGPMDRLVLCSWIDTDKPYIEILNNI